MAGPVQTPFQKSAQKSPRLAGGTPLASDGSKKPERIPVPEAPGVELR